MQFKKSASKKRFRQCEHMAEQIVKAAKMMKLEASSFSEGGSWFAHITNHDDDADPYIVRCCDDPNPRDATNLSVTPDICPSEPIKLVANHFGKLIPEVFTNEAYVSRAKRSDKAAVTRLIKTTREEAVMTNVIAEALRKDRLQSIMQAGKLIDQHYPGIAKAKRQRIAHAAYRLVTQKG